MFLENLEYFSNLPDGLGCIEAIIKTLKKKDEFILLGRLKNDLRDANETLS